MRLAPSQLTIREIIGQLMMPMLPDTPELSKPEVWKQVVEDQEKYTFGGYIVFRADWAETPPLMEELQDLSEIPLLYSSDLERGAGQQFAGATNFPAVMSLGAARDPDLAYQQGAITALEARRAGVHWVFAPTLDLVTQPENPIINVRGFGDEPRNVGLMGAAFIEGMQRHGALACAKHFPGHGETSVDSHEELPVVGVSRHKMELGDLVPFRHCIEAGVKSIMVGHLAVPALDENGLPASMSTRMVADLLRGQMGFKGLVVTDALNMGAIAGRFEPGYAAVRALQAGVDVLLMPPDPEAVVTAVLRSIEEGGLSKARLLESVERIFQAKYEVGLWRYDDEEETGLPAVWPDYAPAVEAIAEGAITLVSATDGLLPLQADGTYCSLVLDDDEDLDAQAGWRQALADHPDLPIRVLTNADDEAAIEAAVAQAAAFGTVLVPAFMAVRAWKNRVSLPPLLASVPDRLRAAGAKVVVVSFTSPFLLRQFPGVDAYVCAYSPNPASQRAAVRALFGELPFVGRLPVNPAHLGEPTAR
ncbi:MAG: beta-lactamase [Cyanobacteria bacterium RYN_339]|nr:beta-lactamase [Cyanobacteria bacterium RYN_339]